jgi:ribosomal protein S18 acetylase RimI-like enzyme
MGRGESGHTRVVTTRPVGPDDLDLICRHREEMFRASNAPGRSDELLRTMTASFRGWIEPRLRDGSYFGYIAEDGGAAVGGIGLMIIDWPPHPSHPNQDKRGYVLNVFVEPSHRRRGLAKMLMDLGEAEIARRGVAFAVLHATRMGRPLYEQTGWSQTAEMSKQVR